MINQKIYPYQKKILSLTLIILLIYISIIIKPKTIRIMPIGDSITDGAKSKGSYRKYLYNSLIKNKFSIKMVGPVLSDKFVDFKDETENFSYEASHCGYCGYTIKANKDRKGIMDAVQNNNYLIKYKPDVVILMIGTNDIQINEDVETIISNLKDFILYIKNNIKKSSLIFVSSIPPLNPNTEVAYNWFKDCREDKNKKRTDNEVKMMVEKNVENYNKSIKELVNNLKNEMINIYFSDMGSVLPNVETFCYDGVHPNEKGHKLMADYLYKQLSFVLKKFK